MCGWTAPGPGERPRQDGPGEVQVDASAGDKEEHIFVFTWRKRSEGGVTADQFAERLVVGSVALAQSINGRYRPQSDVSRAVVP